MIRFLNTCRVTTSIDFQAGGVYHRCPALHFGSHECGELLRVEISRLDALRAEPLANVGQLQDPPHFGVEPVDDLGGHPRGPGEGKPYRRGKLWITELRERRHIRKV